jgi:glycosyltransferase involved in cell wall biosynthesis
MPRKRICIIAFKHARSTIHVLRQIDYLSQDYDLTVIGHGDPDPEWNDITWHAIPELTFAEKYLTRLCFYSLGRLLPAMYDRWYWRSKAFKAAYRYASESQCDAIHANDWQSLPIAIEVARRTKARVVFHQHEYAELEREGDWHWRLLIAPGIRHYMAKYTSDPAVPVDASITVCQPIADRYRRELGIDPIIVYNAPNPVDLPHRSVATNQGRIRLIHHGYAQQGRGIDNMIKIIALTDERFTLDLMLMEGHRGYLDHLKQLATELAPGKVCFRDPVKPSQIVPTVAEYDIGLCVITPSTYNFLMMLPNKLFEYIQAGLAVCIGPSPAMVEVVRPHGVGICAPSFEPGDVAMALNQLTVDKIEQFRKASRVAARTLNADVEMAKVVNIYHGLLEESLQLEEPVLAR